MVEYDILIRNGLIVTLDKDRRVIEGGFVAISGDRIEKVGKDPTGITAEKIIDAKGKIVM
ncbi:MAG TPA: amidohydrolase, partial [Desulfurococcales archaeon]|nr:amidohydrolase [Desulfurococcales archaeon]